MTRIEFMSSSIAWGRCIDQADQCKSADLIAVNRYGRPPAEGRLLRLRVSSARVASVPTEALEARRIEVARYVHMHENHRTKKKAQHGRGTLGKGQLSNERIYC